MLKTMTAIVLVVVMLLMMGCAAHTHYVGQGSQTGETVSKRQWYILWGLIPLGEVDSQAMAGGAQDYEVDTVNGPLDIILNIFTGIVTINSRTVTVTK